MKRRDFLHAAVAGIGALALSPASGQSLGYRNLLILIELKGANDSLNTVIPFADPLYRELRPRIAIARDQVLQLSENTGLHPSLAPLMPLWQRKELAIVQGLGYPEPNLSHFRSIEIWDTASSSAEYLDDGWLTRAFTLTPPPATFATDGAVIGSSDLGPLGGRGARIIALANPADFLRQARFARRAEDTRNAALAHILKVESDIVTSAKRLVTPFEFRTEFPRSNFGNAVRSAAQLAANPSGLAVLRLSHGGFDTHANQLQPHANLLRELAEGLVALRSALLELNRWDSTLILTYAEFGRRPRENQSQGTDHGTAAAHFALGGRVNGGLLGAAPELARLDGGGNLPFTIDFRSLYGTVLEGWWGLDRRRVLKGSHPTLDLLRA
jgi:uncharacterized protein (DUF1501 family)